jgi:hypothetical protein
VLVGTWTGEFDKARSDLVLSGEFPFDESDMLDDDEDPTTPVGELAIETNAGSAALAQSGPRPQ